MIVWIAFHTKEEPNSCVINSGCSNHMTGGSNKFINLNMCNSGPIKFCGEESAQICEKGNNNWWKEQNRGCSQC